MDKTLASIYLDPRFGGLDAIYRTVKEKGETKISRKQVQNWLSQQDVYPLHKPARRNCKCCVIVRGIDDLYRYLSLILMCFLSL